MADNYDETKHFLSIADWRLPELEKLLELGAKLKNEQKAGKAHRLLEGKSLAMIFEKASTRTRMSFEVGIFQLGGQPLFISSQHSQMGRGEPIKDTARVMSRYVHGIMIRTFAQSVVEEFAQFGDVPVINGLTDLLHPCQIMADIMTVIEHKGDIKDRTIAWIGDGNNMANSWLNAAAKFGFSLRLACPEGYDPNPEILAAAKQANPDGILVTRDPKEAASGADVVTTDVFASMGQEDEAEKRLQAFQGFQVDSVLMKTAAPGAVFLHCLPAHRGEEVSEEVFESAASVVWDEAENRLHVQKAIMATLMQ